MDDSPAQTTNLRELIERQPMLAAGIGAGLIVIATLLAYLPVMSAGFVWQDDIQIIGNPLLRDGTGLGKIWADVIPHPSEYTLPQYYPLTYTSHWLEYRLWGTDPLGYHLVNLLLHIGNALLVWLVLSRLKVPGSWVAGLIFALHPINVETVAWISQRANLLGMFFFLCSLYVYLRFSGVIVPAENADRLFSLPNDPQRLYWLAMTLFLCALFSKTFFGTMPAVALLLIWWKCRRLTGADFRPALPMLGLSIVLGILTVYMERYRVGVALRPQFWDFAPTFAGEVAARCIIAGRAVWFYLLKLIVPFPLIFNYPRWNIDATNAVQFLFPFGLLAIVVAAFLARKRLGSSPSVSLLYFIGTLVPVLGFIGFWQMQYSFVADHLVYLSGIGVFALVAATAARYLDVQKLAWPIGVLAIALMYLTFVRARVFRNDSALWADVLIKTENQSWLAYTNYAQWLREASPYTDPIVRLNESEKGFKHAHQLDPRRVEPLYNLAVNANLRGTMIEAELAAATQPSTQSATAPVVQTPTTLPDGYFQQAVQYLNDALVVDPNYMPAHFLLAERLLAMGRTADAVPHYNRCIALSPRFETPMERMATIWMKAGRPEVAEGYLRSLADLEPNSANIHRDLGWVLYLQGNSVAARQQWESAITLAPNDARLLNTIGARLISSEDYTLAAGYLSMAYNVDPGSPDIPNSMGLVFAKLGKPDEAKKMFDAALKQDPDFAPAKQNLADLESGKLKPATTRASTAPATTRPVGEGEPIR